ncbi:MAG: hypothetical protein IH867_14325 [Chloroflexi bacterium]|nr:hypothetical protein [Chloroflexota bacterium]
MIGKNMILKRSVMVAIAVIALMTLTAGVAAAASSRSKFTASADVGLVGLDPFVSTVDSEFKVKKSGAIKWVKITTVGEGVFSDPGSMSMDSCTEKGKHSAGACDATSDILDGATVMSIHSSTAKLKVIFQDPSAEPMFLVGTLKGKLAATITISSSGGDVLSGPGTLKIRSTDLPSTYICLGAGFVPVELADCINASGPQTFGADPVMVPAELHVIDTGKFSIESPTSGIQMKGKLQVVVDVIGVAASGKIEVTKGRAIFP